MQKYRGCVNRVMVGRTKLTSGDAKRTTIYLNPDVDLALNLIENSRRIRKEKRYQPSEIISDALWFYLEKSEGKTREQIIALLPTMSGSPQLSNLKKFPDKNG